MVRTCAARSMEDVSAGVKINKIADKPTTGSVTVANGSDQGVWLNLISATGKGDRANAL